MQALAVSPNRRFLAVSEAAEEQPVLAVYELTAERARRRKVLAADELPARQVVSLAFSPNSQFLAAATAPPEGHLTCWLWEKQQLAASVRVPAAGDGPCQVTAPPPPASPTAHPELCRRLSLLTLPFTADWFFGGILHFSKRCIKGSNFNSTSSRCEAGHTFILQDVHGAFSRCHMAFIQGKRRRGFHTVDFIVFLTFLDICCWPPSATGH